MLNPIVYAVPVFLSAMALEWALARRRGLVLYRAGDTLGSLSAGIVSQLVGLFSKLFTLGLYTAVWQRLAPWPLPVDSVVVWLGALLAYDFCYYWIHRWGHEVNILWAAHQVHHSSEDYNLGTALRQTGSGWLLGWIVYLPMALAGVPPLVFVTVGLIDLLYQFWVHTQLVGRLGWLERVLVTPSNHRVHHGQNDWCLDRNYGGVLIVWDRLFGSFVDERDPVSRGEAIVYGVRQPLRSYSPLAANLQGYAQIGRRLRQALARRRWGDAARAVFGHPGWQPAGEAAKPAFDARQFQRWDPPLPAPLGWVVVLQLGLLLALGVDALARQPGWPAAASALVALALLAQLVVLARLAERGLAAWRGELLRLAAGALALAASPWHAAGWCAAWLLVALATGLLMARAARGGGRPSAGAGVDSAGLPAR